jgi:hypothetical protein
MKGYAAQYNFFDMTVLCQHLRFTIPMYKRTEASSNFYHPNEWSEPSMNNIKKVAKYVAEKPDSADAKTLMALAVALETNAPYQLHTLYELNREAFKLALGLIDDWRLDRHYLSKLTLLDHAESSVS